MHESRRGHAAARAARDARSRTRSQLLRGLGSVARLVHLSCTKAAASRTHSRRSALGCGCPALLRRRRHLTGGGAVLLGNDEEGELIDAPELLGAKGLVGG